MTFLKIATVQLYKDTMNMFSFENLLMLHFFQLNTKKYFSYDIVDLLNCFLKCSVNTENKPAILMLIFLFQTNVPDFKQLLLA